MFLYIGTYQQFDGVNELVRLLSGSCNVVLMSSSRSVTSLELKLFSIKMQA